MRSAEAASRIKDNEFLFHDELMARAQGSMRTNTCAALFTRSARVIVARVHWAVRQSCVEGSL